MKSENIITALNDIDPELVEDAEGAHKRSSVTVFLKWGAAAAVLCLICGLALGRFLPMLQPPILESKPSTPIANLPVYEGIVYTAEEIAGFFGTHKGETTSYTKVYVPSSAHLQPHKRQDTPFWTLYRYNIPSTPLNQTEFEEFFDSKLTRIASELGINTPQYSIRETSVGYTDRDLEIFIDDADGYLFSANHNAIFNSILIANNTAPDIALGDVRIEVDQTKSNAEIIASLSQVKKKLFELFGVSFSDIKITRYYSDQSEHGVEWLYVSFYNKTDHPLNLIADGPYSDCITLEFNNRYSHDDANVSGILLQNVGIRYCQFRSDPKSVYLRTKQVSIISLQEAEALLQQGYVFGGHSCPICMAEQDAVDFSDYDFVDIVYIQSRNPNQASKDIIPFYAFYKKIGFAENGNEIYAKTYVPAIRVSGYEEYFKSQEAEHKN